jgi:DMSO/TMAO reductase YedYZ molybdopterin-dependent catalytic subunit
MEMNRRTAALAGLLAGIVAALFMVLAMLLMRLVWGVASVPELAGDRVAPFLPVRFFFKLLAIAGSYNHLKQLSAGGVFATFIALGAIGGAIYAAARHRPGSDRAADHFLAAWTVAVWLATVAALWPVIGTNYGGQPPGSAAAVTAVGLLLSYAVYGMLLRLLCVFLVPAARAGAKLPESPDAEGRRAFIVAALGVIGGVATGALLRLAYLRAAYAYDGTENRGPGIQSITPNDRFYVVTKNNIDPSPNREVWRLEIAGRLRHPRSYRYDELRALPAVTQETTLQCISNGIGGGLMSNAIWKGVALRTLLEAAVPIPGGEEVLCRGLDGYTDTISAEKALNPTTLIVYEMNGVPLPVRHGFPARLIVPGLVGEKSVKWITRIELLDHRAKGFYERQGWGPNFTLHTTARFDEPDFRMPIPANRPVVLKGIGFAGDRGVERVQVSLNDGVTWNDARLTYRGSAMAWVLWAFTWAPPRPGEYRLAVRAIDGTGAVQTGQWHSTIPEGTTGYHRVSARIV